MSKAQSFSYESYKDKQFSPKSWISKINDDVPLCQLSIPGSENSAASRSKDFINKFTQFIWKTQDLDILQQLQRGIRFFDIHLKCQANEPLMLVNKEVVLSQFKDLVKSLHKFLKQNPEQFVVVLCQKQMGTLNPVMSGKKLIKEITEFSDGEISIYNNNDIPYDQHMPTVGELRGKVMLIQAYTGVTGTDKKIVLSGCLKADIHCNNKIMSDQKTYSVQNFWEGPQELKKQSILKLAKNRDKELLKLNYLTQFLLPGTNCKKYNKWFTDIIVRENLKKIGIVLMNFPEQQHIDNIISANFNNF